jgi:hypothetical protein
MRTHHFGEQQKEQQEQGQGREDRREQQQEEGGQARDDGAPSEEDLSRILIDERISRDHPGAAAADPAPPTVTSPEAKESVALPVTRPQKVLAELRESRLGESSGVAGGRKRQEAATETVESAVPMRGLTVGERQQREAALQRAR